MGSSYSSDLANGSMKEWEKPLREAVASIRSVIGQVYDVIGSDGEYDNAGQDGALAERLGIACELIEAILPKPRPL